MRQSRAFSLIELLTVIAIIAILAAIIFPVFSMVQERRRVSSSMSNLREISDQVTRYELDNNRPPDVLFAYYAPGKSMRDCMSGTRVTTPHGLFPTYINDISKFQDDNNWVTDLNANTTASPVTSPYTDFTGALNQSGASSQQFYQADAYDISPQVTGPNALAHFNYVCRYAPSWTSVDKTLDVINPATGRDDYQRQFRSKSAPDDTYVTCSTYHVERSGTVLVLWKNGSVKAVPVGKFLAPGPDPAAVAVTNGSTNANFWVLSPNGP